MSGVPEGLVKWVGVASLRPWREMNPVARRLVSVLTFCWVECMVGKGVVRSGKGKKLSVAMRC